MILCERCKTQPPQLQGGWYSADNGQWVSCMLCDRLKYIAAMEPNSLAGFTPNPFKKDGPFMEPVGRYSTPFAQPIVAPPYVSIDIETTALPWQWGQILEIGAVIDDWKSSLFDLPRFHCYIVHERIVGDYFALAMNHAILKRIADREKPENREYLFLTPAGAAQGLKKFVLDYFADYPNDKIVAAGKNYARFDDRFLNELPGFSDIKLLHRNLDPGMLYWNPRSDRQPPDTKTCLTRAGIDTEVQHDAINDALDVIRLIRTAVGIPT